MQVTAKPITPGFRALRLGVAGLLLSGAGISVALLAGPYAHGCGPFPPTFLVTDEAAVLAPPMVSLAESLEKLGVVERPEPSQISWQRPEVRTAQADRDELSHVLLARDVPLDQLRRLTYAHKVFRQAVVDYREQRRRWRQTVRWWRETGPPPPPPSANLPPIPEDMPTEFALYLQGAAAYHTGRIDDARSAWQALLELPDAERRHRSVWAAFMLGRLALGSRADQNTAGGALEPDLEPDLEEAERRFLLTRELADHGFTDVLDLARDALGWLGRIELDRGRPARALALYARQAADGRDRSALGSLRRAAEELTRAEPESLIEAADDPLARRAFTAYLIANPGGLAAVPDWPRLWREAGEEPLPEATLQARAAYEAGHFDDADRWLEAAPDDDPIAFWLRGKLRVRDGRLDQAAEALDRAAELLPQEPAGAWSHWEVYPRGPFAVAGEARAEAGVVELARGRFADALDRFTEADDAEDAIYVAERVLTADELASWIDRGIPDHPTYPNLSPELRLDFRLRWILACRLVRLDRIHDALPYFVARPVWGGRSSLRGLAERLREALVCGRGEARADECHGGDRADGYWQAALLTRHNGPELRGTELGPDWMVQGGQIDFGDTLAWFGSRRKLHYLPATEEEMERVARHGPEPPKRWHYRYVAAELAWQAAELLPDGSARKATILTTAGSWLENRDPQAADRFYKALVRCCRNTELGRRADELRWFPPLESSP